MSENFLEKDYINIFEENSLEELKKILKVDELRVYAYEFPINDQGEKGYVDMILEIVKDGNIFSHENSLLVLEFKKNKIKYGPVDQLNFYLKNLSIKQYRKQVIGFLVGPEFSEHEIEESVKNNIHCLLLNKEGNIKLIC